MSMSRIVLTTRCQYWVSLLTGPTLHPHTVAAALLVALGIPQVAAAHAHADSNDDAFIHQLEKDGVWHPSQQVMVAHAHLACSDMSKGATIYQVGKAMWTDNPSLTEFEAFRFVGDATAYYCPQFYWEIDYYGIGGPGVWPARKRRARLGIQPTLVHGSGSR